jgi:hypothetical protein
MAYRMLSSKSVRRELAVYLRHGLYASSINTDALLRLYLPGNGLGGSRLHVYPKSYLRALGNSGVGWFTKLSISAFNNSPAGQDAIAAAKVQLEQDFADAIRKCPGTGCILLADVPGLLVTTPGNVLKWVIEKRLEAFLIGGKQVIDAERLYSQLRWSL